MIPTKDELLESEGIALNWHLIVEFVADWIEAYGPYDDDGDMVREWRRDMLP
jgi:hypothetical protein